MPYFSVIIPTYNRYESAKAAVDSVLCQTFRDFELIVVDDGSTDRTPLLEEEYTGKIRYLRQENRGVSAARNAGIRAAAAGRIAFLDSDDLWLPEKLSEQLKFTEKNPGVLIHQTDEIWIRRGTRVNPKKIHLKPAGDIFIESLGLCLISPSAVVMHRSLFDTYGLFDELMPACEDYDLWLRITSKEKVGLIKKGLIIKHGGHPDQLSRRFSGMDLFRVYAILKLLANEGGVLDPEYRKKATSTALQKLAILKNGAVKRKNTVREAALDLIIRQITDGNGSRTDYPILLQI